MEIIFEIVSLIAILLPKNRMILMINADLAEWKSLKLIRELTQRWMTFLLDFLVDCTAADICINALLFMLIGVES